jgi:hypothetical protein
MSFDEGEEEKEQYKSFMDLKRLLDFELEKSRPSASKVKRILFGMLDAVEEIE